MLSTLALIVFAYLLGSIPFGLVLSKAAGLGDIRSIGSGNIGATNVLRTGNKKIAGLTLVCDVAKGFAPVWIAQFYGSGLDPIFAGFAALAGHIYPVWLGFKGGKGVATMVGVLLAWSWPVALIALSTWIVIFGVKRISSLSALLAAIAATFAAWFFAPLIFWAIALAAIVVFITHRANIARLLKGEESKSTFSKAK